MWRVEGARAGAGEGNGSFPGTAEALVRSMLPASGQDGRLPLGRERDPSLQPPALLPYPQHMAPSSEAASLELKRLEMQDRTLNLLSSLLKDKESSREKEGQAKRKSKEETISTPQEPIMFLEEAYRIEDDAHETIDTKLRQKLRPINADPKSWWVKGAFNKVESPILGASLYTEHLMPGAVAEKTIMMAHDRGAHLELKNFLSKNSNVLSESKKKLKVLDDLAGEMHLDVRTDWQAASTVWEAVDAGLNYAAVEFQIRGYNYSPLAMIRCLHESR